MQVHFWNFRQYFTVIFYTTLDGRSRDPFSEQHLVRQILKAGLLPSLYTLSRLDLRLQAKTIGIGLGQNLDGNHYMMLHSFRFTILKQ